jgi:hypothetical protein
MKEETKTTIERKLSSEKKTVSSENLYTGRISRFKPGSHEHMEIPADVPPLALTKTTSNVS